MDTQNHNDPEEQEEMTEETSLEGDGIAQLQAELEAKELKIKETQERMLYLAADFENARKRWDKERVEVRQYAMTDFGRDLLPVIDAMDKAITTMNEKQDWKNSEHAQQIGAIFEGVLMVSKVFSDCLAKHGVEKLPGKGHPFDPRYHNAVSKIVDNQVKTEMVADEFVPGYKIGDRVLRTAMVVVAAPE